MKMITAEMKENCPSMQLLLTVGKQWVKCPQLADCELNGSAI
jgi:hypothetical protein